MALNIVDVSNWQDSLNLFNINYDGVAIKATEGVSYVNPDCDRHYQQAKAQGKKRAVYHFFDFGIDPIAQADFFVNNCRGYIRDAIFVLDWEGSGVADINAALAFLQRVEALIGYKPAIYMSQWVENHYDWSAVVNNNNGLWIARYSNWELQNHAHDWDMSQAGQPPAVTHWPFYFMWQWTSTGLLNGYAGNLDCDIAYVTPDAWDRYAGVVPPEPTTTTTTTVPPLPAPSTTEAPSTTSTTTEAPTTITTTTDSPVPPQSETTTTTEVPVSTATTTVAPDQSATWLTVIWSIIIIIIERLQGKVQ